MHALKPGGVRIPRAYRDHRRVDGIRYRVYVTALLARLGGPLDAAAMGTVRQAGILSVELENMGRELEEAKRRRRRRDLGRLRRQMIPMRSQLLNYERRLEELAVGQAGSDDPVANVRRAVEEANAK
jgi:hypothetical protein